MSEAQEPQAEEPQPGAQTEAPGSEPKYDVSGQLDKIWHEIKDIAKQLESETRRGGRIARLRFDIRGLRRDFDAVGTRVGAMIYEAQMAGGKRPTLSKVAGYDEAIEKMAGVRAQIAAKEDEIAELQRQDATEA